MTYNNNPRIYNIDMNQAQGKPLNPTIGTIINIRNELYFVEKPQPHKTPCQASHLCTCLDFTQCRRCGTTLTRIFTMPYKHRHGFPVYLIALHNQTLFFSTRLTRDTDNPSAPNYNPTYKSFAALMSAISKTETHGND